tara:strand:- start:708 stop:1214 length:507 start_codon:yes stop_codon:yes gene_type:complete
MATFRDYQPVKFDDFFTQENTFKQISKFIPKDKKIYMPFYSPYSKCNELLGKYIDNEIVYEDKDFFSYNITDGIIVDNPPFSIKQSILKKLYEDDTPFMLILPISSICYKYFRMFNDGDIQMLIFNGRPKYNKCNTEGVIDNGKSSPAFDSAVFCYKIGLKKDLIFMD